MASQMYVSLLRQSVIIIIILASRLRRFSSHARPRIRSHERLLRFFYQLLLSPSLPLSSASLTHLLACDCISSMYACGVPYCERDRRRVCSFSGGRIVSLFVHSNSMFCVKKNIIRNEKQYLTCNWSQQPNQTKNRKKIVLYYFFSTQKFQAK